MRPYRLEAPSETLVNVADLRLEVRFDTDEQDTLLIAYESAAVAVLDGYSGRLGRCLLRQKWALPITSATEAVFLPFPDCREFMVEEQNPDESWAEVVGVSLQGADDCVAISGLPTDAGNLRLTCIAGWDTADDVPMNLTLAVRLLVRHWFDYDPAKYARNATAGNFPPAVDALISPYCHVFV